MAIQQVKHPTVVTIRNAGIEPLSSYNQGKLDKLTGNSVSVAEFLEASLGHPLGTIHTLSRREFSAVAAYPKTEGKRFDHPISTVSPLFGSAYGAFNHHQNFALSPEVVWYAIMHEIGRYVKDNVEECAFIFNGDPKKKKVIKVRDDTLVYGSPDNDWTRTIGAFRPQLEEHIMEVGRFIPDFSTLNNESYVALVSAFMDAASSYYRYIVETRCGIPEIRLVGQESDWRLVAAGARNVGPLFGGLDAYFQDLYPVLDEIASAAAGNQPDPQFWNSLFKYKSESGGAAISGWLTTLVAYAPNRNGEVLLRNSFNWRDRNGRMDAGDLPSHVSSVPVLWDYLGEKHDLKLVAGVLGADYDEESNYLTPKLGWGLIEPPQNAGS